jgi:hypothetical protein
MTLLIVISILVLMLIIGLYQLLIQKYYWGPKGPPQKDEGKREPRRR